MFNSFFFSIPGFFFLNCLLKKGKEKTGRCVQGQCKCLGLVNGESRENVSKQTTAVTHSHGEMHINTCGQGGGKRQWQKRKQRWGGGENKDEATCWRLMHKHTHASYRTDKTCNLTKSPPQTSERAGGSFHLSTRWFP